MLFGPAVSCRAVQRRIRPSSDAVWITDDNLSAALQRFCVVARCLRRDASSVPGPMESRRRIGKRRIAHLSEAVHIPGQDFSALWDISGALGSQKWQWEAPSRREPLPVTTGAIHLPTWLNEYEPALVDQLSEEPTGGESMMEDAQGLFTNVEEDLRIFKKSLKAVPTNQVQALCNMFNHSFRQNAILGLISEDMISESLRCITETVREATVDESLAASRCFSFYKATWDGITGSKVLRPLDLDGNLLEHFLILLGELPSTPAVQNLAIGIIQTASKDQIIRMEDGVSAVVRAWLSSWTSPGTNCVQISTEAILSRRSHHAPITAPSDESKILAKFLSYLRPGMARRIILASTDHLISNLAIEGSIKIIRNLRYSWISVVANTSCVDETLLLAAWSKMNASRFSSENNLSLHKCCNLLLDFWTSHGQIKRVEKVREVYMASIQKFGQSGSAGHLMQALNQCNERWWKKAECLFRFLRYLGMPQFVHEAFRNLVAQDLTPASFVGRQIYAMTIIDPRCALNMYRDYDKVQHGKAPFLPDWCPSLISAMIKSPNFAPKEIWDVLRIPLFMSRSTTVSYKPLHPSRIRLIHKMALEFAAAECRTPRVALRNVLRCMLYLRRHGIPVSSDLSRALTDAGITRSLLSEHWIGRRKAEWILDIVGRVEGLEVSAKTGQVLQLWLAQRIAQQQKEQREANPLRIGVIG